MPRPLQAAMGRRRFIKSLKTRDVHTARARRHAALADFEAELGRVRARVEGSSHLATVGMEWRDTLERVDRGDPDAVRSWRSGPVSLDDADAAGDQDYAAANVRDALGDAMEALEADRGEAAARHAYAIATGKITPLAHYVAAWLAEGGAKGPLKERTKAQYRSDIDDLVEWLKSSGVPPTVEGITKRVVGRYVTEGMVANGVGRKTANRKISAASSYWRWLVKRGVVEGNPWSGQSLSKVGAAGGPDTRPRAFTDAEVTLLLSGDADQELRDVMRVAALSGMRIEEAYRLTVADCADSWFRVRQAKTRAGIRRVPIHSCLSGIVARRTADKQPAAYLFPEPGTVKPGRERSMAASKRFGHYRRRVGVDDTPEGQRQSRTTFHSWRRWFVTKARAGFDLAVVQAIVGHDSGNLTDDVYSAGPSEEAKRACVEAVKLPAHTKQAAE